MKKIAVVVQRYGGEVVGGAEMQARLLAEKMQSHLGWQVDVLTTTAKEYTTWKNFYPEGRSELHSVNVHRFDSFWGRSLFLPIYSRFLFLFQKIFLRRLWTPLQIWFELKFLILQGPVNFKLSRYIKQHRDDYDAWVFFTYLYLPTVWGISLVQSKVQSRPIILVPEAHDEPAFYFSLFKSMFQKASHIFVNSVSEKELMEGRIGKSDKIQIVGLGFDENYDQEGEEEVLALDPPYVLYLGRISRGKKIDELIQFFHSFLESSPFKNVNLYLAGHVEEGVVLPQQGNIRYLGHLSESDKSITIRQALCLVNPSPLESLSMVVLEAVMLKKPVLVNQECSVFRYYESVMPSVYGYRDDFNAKLSFIAERNWRDDSAQKDLGESQRWVREHYSWEKILRDYQKVLGDPF